MILVGDAIMEVTGAFRMNYAVMGNTVPYLHASCRALPVSRTSTVKTIPGRTRQTCASAALTRSGTRSCCPRWRRPSDGAYNNPFSFRYFSRFARRAVLPLEVLISQGGETR